MSDRAKGRLAVIYRWARAALAIVGLACAIAWATPATAVPEDAKEPAPQGFLSGGARSIVVLDEIKVVLERIDSRLQRIEEHMARSNPNTPSSRNIPNPTGATENVRGNAR